MESKSKIKQEELETILGQQKEINSLLSNIGLLESQKHGLLHKIAEVNKSVEDFKSILQKEYGDININLEDGSYTIIDKEKSE